MESRSDRVAVVTGAARGIGNEIAKRLAQAGHRVALVDVDAGALEGATSWGESERTATYAVDVTDPDAVNTAVSRIADAFGGVHVLVNNAGIAGRSLPTWDLTDDDWSSVLNVNLFGTFYCTRAVLPHMRRMGWGRIVNVASIAGKEGNPNAVPYSASKAGIIGLTKAVAKEVAKEGILVNAVTPAVIQTDILQQVSEEHLAYMLSRIPMGRPGEAAEVAELVLWLASDKCSFSTGAVFDISGGRATY